MTLDTAALYLAALLLLVVGMGHSYLGERYLLQRIFRRCELPKIFGSSDYTRRILRFAWHLTTVAWLGLAGVLLLLAHPPANPRTIALVVALTFLVHGATSLVGARGKHYSWIPFLGVGLLAGWVALH
ncbi:hypothetical protein [Pseudoduganella sp. OTU4001]|uniref:hypothetical protein n=1 Tax=Pseudoduganella sp. OTU4001 TaxID=3043854 RepID=UPI00313C673B